jgi:hypothetical protein
MQCSICCARNLTEPGDHNALTLGVCCTSLPRHPSLSLDQPFCVQRDFVCRRLLQVVLFLGQGIKAISFITAATSSMILVNQVAPAHELGAVVGAGQMCAAFMRALGPAMAGQAWGLSVEWALPAHQFLAFGTASLGLAGGQLLYHPSLIDKL